MTEALKKALHEISLASQCSMSSKEECGRIARTALTQATASEQGEPDDIEAIIACLGDDAATLRDESPEIADNLDAAAEALRKLYTAQPAPAARPMTREQVKDLMEQIGLYGASAAERAHFINGIRHAEAHHHIGSQPTAPAVPADGCAVAAAGTVALASALHRIKTGNLEGAAEVVAKVREMLIKRGRELAAPAAVPEGVAKNAARYVWLRDASVPPHNFYLSVPAEFDGVKYQPSEVDAYIDATLLASAPTSTKGGV
jgi:hypothetical protein